MLRRHRLEHTADRGPVLGCGAEPTDRALDRVVMDAQLRRDGTCLELLKLSALVLQGLEQLLDLNLLR
ncbi:MAG: hypothetical protein MJD61_11000 [Proteobacteria bacterium]|nr:hypothetical protein [Pseudomonadota bacterium]